MALRGWGMGIDELFRVYYDLEKTLQQLRRAYQRNSELSLRQIDVKKLMAQLSRHKRKIERKIANTLLLEKDELKRKLKLVVVRSLSAPKEKITHQPAYHEHQHR
jgi:hypothetical protein